MNKIINSNIKINVLEVSIKNHYSQWDKLGSLDGRLLILLAFWRESNINLTEESSIGELLKLIFNLNDETTILFEKALFELKDSGTISCSTNSISFASKLEEITVNEKVVEWLKNDKFLKLKSLKTTETENVYFVDFNGEYEHSPIVRDDFEREGSAVRVLSEVKFRDNLQEKDLFKLAERPMVNENLELFMQEPKSCYAIDALFECSFKVVGSEILFADKHTSKIFAILPKKERIAKVQQVFSEQFEINEAFETADSEDELEEILNPKKFIENINKQNLIDQTEGIYMVNNEFFKPFIVNKDLEFEEENFSIKALAKLVYTSDEVAEIVIDNKSFLNLENISTNLATSIFKRLWGNATKLSPNETNWMIKEILIKVPVEELYKKIDGELLFLLTDKIVAQLIQLDLKLNKDMKFKEFVNIKRIFDLMVPIDVFKYYNSSIEKASENKLLGQVQEFIYLKLVDKFMKNFDFDNLDITKDELEKNISEFANIVNAAQPFIVKESEPFMKKLKSLKIKLFAATEDEVRAAAGKLRDRLEEIVCEELSISSVPNGQFKKYASKMAKISKSELSSMNSAYGYASDQLHYKLNSDKKKDPDSVIKKLEIFQEKYSKV